MTASQTDPLKVVIAGGGVAGLEAMLALRALAAEHVEVTLLSNEESYIYEPLSVGTPFGVSEARHYRLEQLAADHGARFVQCWVREIDAARHVVVTDKAGEMPYDALLVAAGARRVEALHSPPPDAGSDPASWPLPSVLTYYGNRNAPGVHDLLEALAAGRARRIAFIVPHGMVWPFPLYELALMTGTFALERGLEAELVLVTPAPAPLALFGHRADERMTELLAERRIEVLSGQEAHLTAPGRLMLEPDGRALTVDRVVTLPELIGPDIRGLPHDQDGYIPVDEQGRVIGLEDVYAAGDCIAFPVKQGGLATQEADAAARAIAAAAGADIEPEPFRPVMRGVLFTGAEREYLRTEFASGEVAEGTVEAHTLWWPPAKVAGRYLAPALGQLDTMAELAGGDADGGVPVAVELPPGPCATSGRELFEFAPGGHAT